jgi:NADPH2:quinone reductase
MTGHIDTMKAAAYTETGPATEVLRLVERPLPEPGAGEVRIRVLVSGVNPIDLRLRSGAYAGDASPLTPVVPHSDGAGIVDTVGEGVTELRAGQRVWLWEAAYQRRDGTAQEYVVLPARNAVPLPDDVSFDAGASIGIPAVTAHRALTVHEDAPRRLAPEALAGKTVLVAGGAGAVGHAAIQLARWAGARVVATVSGPEKAALATAAGAESTVDYRATDATTAIREFAPDGVDIIVEVSPVANAKLDTAVLAPHGSVSVYNNTGDLTLPVGTSMAANVRYQFLIAFTMRDQAKRDAHAALAAALRDGVLSVGADAGLPIHRFPLADAGLAHEALEKGVVGKVLVDIP